MIEFDKIYNEDCLQGLKKLPAECVDCCVTSPPYYALRDYGCEGQIGLEETPEKYIERLTEVFMEVHRVLKKEGTLWLNIGDSYATGTTSARQQSPNPGVGANRPEAQNSVPRLGTPKGYKTKDLIGIPWMLAFALRNAGWYLRQDIIWHKPNPMPESVTDRCTKSHEYIFLMSKSQKYFFDYEQIQEEAITQTQGVFLGTRGERGYSNASGGQRDCNGGFPSKIRFGGRKYGDNDDKHYQTYSGNEWKPQYNEDNIMVRNKRDVWTVKVKPDSNAHFATYPEELIRPCILAGCPMGG